MIKAIFFDFDGVVVESTGIKTNAFARLFAPEGEEAAKKAVAYHLLNAGVSRYEKFRYIYKEILRRPLSEEQFRLLCDTFAGFVKDEVIRAPQVKGALEFIEANASRYKFFIISATPQEEMEEIAEKRGIRRFFGAICGAPKSKHDAVREILSKEGITAQSAVYVGDALSDLSAAKDNGVTFIARIHDNKDIFADIDCVKIRDLTELGNIVDRL